MDYKAKILAETLGKLPIPIVAFFLTDDAEEEIILVCRECLTADDIETYNLEP